MTRRFPAALLCFLLVLVACDSKTALEDAGVVTRAQLDPTQDSSPNVTAWSSENEQGLVGGAMLSDTLRLISESRSNWKLRLFDASGNDLSTRVKADPESYQIFYRVDGIPDMKVLVTDKESDYAGNVIGGDLKVGLAFSIETPVVASRRTGTLRVQVGKFRGQQKNGSTLTVEPETDFFIPIHVEPKTPPAQVTRLTVTLDRSDDLHRQVLEVHHSAGLDFDGAEIDRDSMNVDICTRSNRDASYTCQSLDSLVISRGEVYRGRIELVDKYRGEDFEDYVRENGDDYLFTFLLNFSPTGILIKDADSMNRPIGLNFDWHVPTNILYRGTMQLRFLEFDPAAGGDKGQNRSPRELIYLAIPFRLR